MVEQRVRESAAAAPGTAAPAPARRTGGGGVTPYLVLFLTFTLVPAVYGLWISLHDWDYLLPGKPFVGLDNYRALLDPASAVFTFFWQSMQATGIFTLASVPLLVVAPLGIALILNRAFPGRTFFRAVYFAPYVLGVVVIGLLWRFVLDPNLGAVNSLLGAVGLPGAIPWTTGLPWAWISLVGVTVWWTLGFNAVIYLAGLQGHPARAVRGGPHRRRRQVGGVPQCHPAGTASGAALRRDQHRAGFGEHVRPGVPDHPGRAGAGDQDGDHVYRRGGSAQLPDGRGGGHELCAHAGPRHAGRDRLPDQLERLHLAGLLLFSPSNFTLPPGLGTLQGAYNVNYPVIMAGAALASIPALLLFVATQRYVIEGVSRSGLRG